MKNRIPLSLYLVATSFFLLKTTSIIVLSFLPIAVGILIELIIANRE